MAGTKKKKTNSIIGKPALPSQISPFILVPVSTSHNTNNMIEYCSYSILQRKWPTLYTIMIIVCIAMNGCKFPSPLLCFLQLYSLGPYFDQVPLPTNQSVKTVFCSATIFPFKNYFCYIHSFLSLISYLFIYSFIYWW